MKGFGSQQQLTAIKSFFSLSEFGNHTKFFHNKLKQGEIPLAIYLK